MLVEKIKTALQSNKAQYRFKDHIIDQDFLLEKIEQYREEIKTIKPHTLA